jgi:glycosyltransferase involved in cell wall biosynthesis
MKVDKQKRVVFVTSTLNQVGGGERLLLEGVKYYDKIGIDVYVITWNFDKKALFDGKYQIPNLINFDLNSNSGVGDYKYMFNKLLTIFKFRKVLRNLKPDLIISQSENDTTILNIAQLFLKKNYVTLIFGQMFQFPHDHTKYSLVFKKHLKSIVNSFVGYRESIPLINPSKSIFKNVIIEFWSLLRYFSVKKSISTFVFSKQVQWEVKLLYNINSHILKGAFEESILNSNLIKNPLFDFRDNSDQKIILMINRLEKKENSFGN